MRFGAECQEGGEVGDDGCVGVAGATHDDWENVYLDARRTASEGVGKRDAFISDEMRGVREVIVCSVLPFP
jgi:hypothetical protein